MKYLKKIKQRKPRPPRQPLPTPLPPPRTRQPAVNAPLPIVDLPGAYMPPDWNVITNVHALNSPPPFEAPDCDFFQPEWKWRAVFNEAGDKLLLHSPCWVNMGYYSDFDVKPDSVMASFQETYTNVITLQDGRRYRVRREIPPGWYGLIM